MRPFLDDARAALRAGDHARAEARARAALAAGYSEAHVLLMHALKARGMLDKAEQHARAALLHDPADFLTEAHLGAILMARGEMQAALGHYRAAAASRPDIAELQNELGVALVQAGQLVEAEAALRHALALRPEIAEIHNNLGNVLKRAGRLAAAAACYRAALDRKSDYPEALSNLGVVQQLAGDLEGAMASYRRAIALRPDDGLALTHLGAALAAQGRLTEAEAMHRAALARAPDLAEVHNNLGILLKDQGRFEEAAQAYRAALAIRPDDAAIHSNLLLCLCGDPAVNAPTLLAAHREWAACHAPSLPATPAAHDPERVLRIGYVSPDFRSHSVASFIEPVLVHHDRSRFFVACYAELSAADETTARLRGFADLWRDTAALSDEALAQRIRDDGIDILVDLAGHTAGNRLPVFGRRPAPVQASWIGYPATTGLAAIDYRLTDAWADPPGESECGHAEALLRLPSGFLCYAPPADSPPARTVSRDGPTVFGSFNNLSKVTPAVIALWARVLHAVPKSRLLLKSRQLGDAGMRKRIIDGFEKHGIPNRRLDLRGRMESRADHLALYASVDVALDSFPYNGATTTCEALWMGVPVVVLAGERHAGRVGVSLLTRAGLPAMIAENPEQYVAVAARLAAERPEPSALREAVARSPLCDAAGFTAALEETWRAVWRRRCAERTA